MEFFPPKTEATARDLLLCAEEISLRVKPDFVAITDGAGGSTRELTFLYSQLLRSRFGWTIVPHLTCLGRDPEELMAIAESYARMGVRSIMVLRGDKRPDEDAPSGSLKHAYELVSLIRRELPDMCVGVAGYPEKHPEAPTLEEDIRRLKEKVDCGASWITTQLFFKPELYESFLSKCRQSGIRIPIIPGLLPALSLEQAQRFCQISRATMPDHLTELMKQTSSARQWEAGVEYLLSIIPAVLKAGAPGMHLYILNRSRSLIRLLDKLSETGKFKTPKNFW